ncbi:4-coumarate--CoA ligase-like 3 [Sorghum bicolor]|uniref:AMP-dependent synthetase/ligase domain-containing protein n=1 Tax=Sorghum bicolor TaxID=4558 RepID=C5XW17_SORBI|nr:4-coumarate--CoA ligase-like 3 [Sorghum bicolor]EES06043.1 hypothetical protein SORBI_3004G350600 [Sorghum bicolor]|eukprot:XP_002453067.1 4-coumarate--CoA ligase-like 3 [Sorghum bicolor]
MEERELLLPVAGDDAAAFVLSRLPHPGTAAADAAAFVDATAGTSLSFSALRRAALSLASALRLGLGLRRGDVVLVLSHNSLLLPQVLLGVLAAGAVVAAADPDATPAEVGAAARDSGAVMVVAAPEVAAKLSPNAMGLPPLLLTSRSPEDPAALSAEELIDGGDPVDPAAEMVAVSDDSDVAFLAYPSATTAAVAMTHADLVAAIDLVADGGRRVCLASLPMYSAHGLPLLALGLPAAGVTTVLLPPPSSASQSDARAAREAVAAHAATDFVATPDEAEAALAAPVPLDGQLSSLRRVIVAPTPLTPGAREEFRRRLPWVQLTQLLSGTPENQTELLSLPPEVITPPTGAAVIQHNSLPADPMSATNDASLVPPPKKINKIISGGIFSRSTMSKILRKHPETGNRQAASKL